jgi:ABC-2 type transport system permease protein
MIPCALPSTGSTMIAARTEGTLDYMRSLPIPRVVYLLADLTVQLLVVLPGVIFGVLVATWRFRLPIAVSPWVVPAVILVVLTATSAGYAMASVLPPLVANLMSQVLVVLVFMFSPLQFPADRLPDWLAAIHRVLPIQAMGEVMRGTLAPAAFPVAASSFMLLGTWCVITFAVSWRVLARRG